MTSQGEQRLRSVEIVQVGALPVVCEASVAVKLSTMVTVTLLMIVSTHSSDCSVQWNETIGISAATARHGMTHIHAMALYECCIHPFKLSEQYNVSKIPQRTNPFVDTFSTMEGRRAPPFDAECSNILTS